VARVFIDPHMFSADWFKPILIDLIGSKRVTFLFANCEKGLKELSKVRAALEFRKNMTQLKRAKEASADAVEFHVDLLNDHADFISCRDCDDPHIMAAIYLLPTKFVFSEDQRMARCRKKLNSKIDKKYLSFIIISNREVYIDHKPIITK
jgi:predicted nucleic acid-binding protein